MKVEKQPNGQYIVTHENMELTQTIVKGVIFNDCSINEGEICTLVSEHDQEFRPLFIALHNFKINE